VSYKIISWYIKQLILFLLVWFTISFHFPCRMWLKSFIIIIIFVKFYSKDRCDWAVGSCHHESRALPYWYFPNIHVVFVQMLVSALYVNMQRSGRCLRFNCFELLFNSICWLFQFKWYSCCLVVTVWIFDRRWWIYLILTVWVCSF
jgi:hypothetical protein